MTKKVAIAILGSLGLILGDFLLKKCFIVAGLNTNHSTVYYLLNWGCFLLVMWIGKLLVPPSTGPRIGSLGGFRLPGRSDRVPPSFLVFAPMSSVISQMRSVRIVG